MIPGEWFSSLPSRVSAVVCPTWAGARISHLCTARPAVCMYRVTASVQFRGSPFMQSIRDSPSRFAIRAPNRFWIYEKFPSRRFISVRLPRKQNTVYLSDRTLDRPTDRQIRAILRRRARVAVINKIYLIRYRALPRNNFARVINRR